MRFAPFSPAAVSLGLLAANNPAWADERPYPYHMMWGGGGFMGPVMMLLFFAVIVVLVVLLVRWLWPGHMSGSPGSNGKSALSILEERYARGEIDKEEFEEKKRVIGR